MTNLRRARDDLRAERYASDLVEERRAIRTKILAMSRKIAALDRARAKLEASRVGPHHSWQHP